MAWLAVADGYEVTLHSGEVICRNRAGTQLRSVPKAVRDDPAVAGLRRLTQWLEQHEARCRADIERWMIRSLPVPAAVLASVWPDRAWRDALTDLVVAGASDGGWDPDEVGFLREVSPAGIGVVKLDGESVRLAAPVVVIPHPVLLPELDEIREFAADLGVRQRIDQLFREVWRRPAGIDPEATAIGDYAGGRYEQLRYLAARAGKLGFPVRGGNAVCRVFEAGRAVEARSWVGSDDPYYETETGNLVFTDQVGHALPLAAVGPVAWSEGVRMAAALYAGRVVEKAGEGE